jgi:hypothetical protein
MADPVVIGAVQLDMDDYLSAHSPDLQRSYTNLQANHFARRVCDDPANLGDENLLDAAIASLDEYDLVGVFADPQGFVDLYCDALAVPRQIVPHMNITASRRFAGEMSGAVLRRLLHCNGVDLALYAWACQRFAAHRNKTPKTSARRACANTFDETRHPEQQSGPNFGTRDIEIVAVDCRGSLSNTTVVAPGESMIVTLHCRARVTEPELTAGLAVRDGKGATVFGTNSRLCAVPLAVASPGEFTLILDFDPSTEAGEYSLVLALHKGLTHVDGCYHWIDNAATFTVAGNRAELRGADDGVVFRLVAA